MINAVLGDFDSIETAMKRSYRRDVAKAAPPPRRPVRLRRRADARQSSGSPIALDVLDGGVSPSPVLGSSGVAPNAPFGSMPVRLDRSRGRVAHRSSSRSIEFGSMPLSGSSGRVSAGAPPVGPSLPSPSPE